MNQPSEDQLELVQTIIRESIISLIANDSNIFHIDLNEVQYISEEARILNRKLHETTINHRLAVYLEQNISNNLFEGYNVDIEYNRFFENDKILETIEGQIIARPDIIIHSRTNQEISPNHILVVEAKKGGITEHDVNKIMGFISDGNYNYLFGLTVSYCQSEEFVVSTLYYFNGEEIISTEINVEKNEN